MVKNIENKKNLAALNFKELISKQLKLIALTSLEMTGIPVISELKNEASKTDFNMNPKEKLNEWQPFHMVYELRISKNVLVLLITFRIR